MAYLVHTTTKHFHQLSMVNRISKMLSSFFFSMNDLYFLSLLFFVHVSKSKKKKESFVCFFAQRHSLVLMIKYKYTKNTIKSRLFTSLETWFNIYSFFVLCLSYCLFLFFFFDCLSWFFIYKSTEKKRK